MVQSSEYQRLLNQNIKLSAFVTKIFREYPELSKSSLLNENLLLETRMLNFFNIKLIQLSRR